MSKICSRSVHLDFHTSEKIVEIGEGFDPKDFAATLKKADVQSITCFARCHHGMIYYDTKFAARHPGLKRNLLKEQIDACHEVGIKVPIYIACGWDEYCARKHPEWLERTVNGEPVGTHHIPDGPGPLEAGWKTLCFNTPYADYVEEQTVEVLEKFGSSVDGIFFDILFQEACYCNYCLEGMISDGLEPTVKSDAEKYAKKVLFDFKKRLFDKIRSYNKECPIFFNSGHISSEIRHEIEFYSHMEIESLPSGIWGYEHFPITVRYARNLGLEYTGQTGKFHKSWADFGGFKNKASLEFECFNALANGAKCSIGDQLHPSGVINKSTYELIGSVYSQVKEKETWCEDVIALTDIGVFNPEAIGKSDGNIDSSISGVYRMLIEAHYQFDIIDEQMDFNEYRLIILPDKILLDSSLKLKLDAYQHGGGKIILSYKSGLDYEEKEFVLDGIGIQKVGDAEFSPDYIVAGKAINEGLFDTEYVMYDRGMWVEPFESTEILAKIWNPYFNRTYKHFSSHKQTPIEKESPYPAIVKNDNILYFSHPIFYMYHKNGMKAYKQLVINGIKMLIGRGLVETNAPSTSHITLNYQKKDNRYIVHLLHYIPEKRCTEIETIEEVIPLYNITLQIRISSKVSKVYMAPEMTQLPFEVCGDYINVTVPKVDGHAMVVFEV
ncbi:MAG TPA: beta-galactosidase trimerization domain-containing protein [Ruminiclostridium sp.]